MSAYYSVADINDLKDGKATAFDVAGCAIVLCRSGNDVYALEGRCSHALQPLEGARVRGDTLMCPHHGARFDIRSGKHVAAPAVRGIRTYDVRLNGETVEVCIDKGDVE